MHCWATEYFTKRAVLEGLESSFDPMHALSFPDFPRVLGAASGVAGGAALGGLHHLWQRHKDPEHHGLGNAAASIGAGALLGGGLGFAAGDHFGVPMDTEIDNIKYERQGPVRQLLHAASPIIPTLHGTHDLPADFKANVSDTVDVGERAALGGHVTPNQVTVSTMSPRAADENGAFREQFINNKPVRIPTLDPWLKAENGTTLTGSETPGSAVGYDYNGALKDLWKMRLPLEHGENGVLIGSHAHGVPLAATAGASIGDVVHDLTAKGTINDSTNMLGVFSCNAAGCDIPATVEHAAGRPMDKLFYTPPGGVGVSTTADNLLGSVAARPELRHPDLFSPKHVVSVGSGDMSGPLEAEPAASRYDVRPMVPTAVTQGVHHGLAPLAPVLNHWAPGLHDAIGNATAPHELGLGDLVGMPREMSEAAQKLVTDQADPAMQRRLIDRHDPTADEIKARYPQLFGSGVFRPR